MPGFYKSGNWNESNLNPSSRINWRASLVPAAAVIPAPIAYIKVVAVKKLVVGSRVQACGSFRDDTARPDLPPGFPPVLFTECLGWPERLL